MIIAKPKLNRRKVLRGMLGGAAVDLFVDSVFNFPTLAEAYRVAAERVAASVRAPALA